MFCITKQPGLLNCKPLFLVISRKIRTLIKLKSYLDILGPIVNRALLNTLSEKYWGYESLNLKFMESILFHIKCIGKFCYETISNLNLVTIYFLKHWPIHDSRFLTKIPFLQMERYL